MKTTINITESPMTIKFPCIARYLGGNRNENLIVLFCERTSGTVLHCPDAPQRVGNHDTDWISVYDNQVWEIVPSIVIEFNA